MKSVENQPPALLVANHAVFPCVFAAIAADQMAQFEKRMER